MEAGEIIALVAMAVGVLTTVISWVSKGITTKFDKLDARNSEQHDANLAALREVKGAVGDLSRKFDNHLTWHLDNREHIS